MFQLKQSIEDLLQLDTLFDQTHLEVGSPKAIIGDGGFNLPSTQGIKFVSIDEYFLFLIIYKNPIKEI